jgi:hypothetical protein
MVGDIRWYLFLYAWFKGEKGKIWWKWIFREKIVKEWRKIKERMNEEDETKGKKECEIWND